MNRDLAVLQLAALAHGGRLDIFRLLVVTGEGGLAAGEVARRLGMVQNTLSANLRVLSQAGLISPQRAGRSIIYRAEYGAMTALIGFLVADCCAGEASICAPLVSLLNQAACCPPAPVEA